MTLMQNRLAKHFLKQDLSLIPEMAYQADALTKANVVQMEQHDAGQA
jgi:hypothetical protein